jgi:predicted restriction endonuclease
MTISSKLRKTITERATRRCEYCLMLLDFSHDPFDVEHIKPISQNGKTELNNLALSCHGCNLHKSDKITAFDVVSEELVRLYNPRKDIWNEHFTWAKKFTIIVGLTPIGRATIESLKLNRQGLIN